MEVELLHTKQCHIWKEALKTLRETLKEENLNSEVKITEIKTMEEARDRKFSGTPQVNVNGKDVDPMAEKFTHYNLTACRQYFYKGKHSEYPTKEMIKEALNKT